MKISRIVSVIGSESNQRLLKPRVWGMPLVVVLATAAIFAPVIPSAAQVSTQNRPNSTNATSGSASRGAGEPSRRTSVNTRATPAPDPTRQRQAKADKANDVLFQQECVLLNQIASIRTASVDRATIMDNLAANRPKGWQRRHRGLNQEINQLWTDAASIKQRIEALREKRDRLERSREGIRKEVVKLKEWEEDLTKEINPLEGTLPGNWRQQLLKQFKVERNALRDRIKKLDDCSR